MKTLEDEMQDEYDFSRMSGGVRGKHAGRDIRIIGAEQRVAPAALPCPFCGASNVVTMGDESDHGDGYRATCRTCGASGPRQPSECEARLSWNRREAA